MEDLRNGKLSVNPVSNNRQTSKRKGYWQLPIPELRVLFIGIIDPITTAIIKLYRNVGCKVAVMTDDRINGDHLASNHGVRFYPVDFNNNEEHKKAFTNLLSAWYDIDTIVVDSRISQASSFIPKISERLDSYRKIHPVTKNFGGAVIHIFGDSKNETENWGNLRDMNFSIVSIPKISSYTPSLTTPEDLARLCLFISIPANRFLDGTTIPIQIN